MKKVAIVYWSGTGNTETMANEIEKGAKDAGAEVSVYTASKFEAESAREFDTVVFGCSSMGAEQLEEDEFEPMFSAVESVLAGKEIALFGSYGWGDGEWMRDWQERCATAGATIFNGEGLMINETPDEAGKELCRELGKGIAAS